ncbi:AzlD domain-containing protein [Oceanobacillus sp. CAU 1775]
MSNAMYVIIVMAIVTYLIRVLPLTIIRKDIKNIYVRSFLYYVPFVTLAVMVFPAILTATASIWSALIGFIVAIIFSLRGSSLVGVALVTCLSVFVVELILF